MVFEVLQATARLSIAFDEALISHAFRRGEIACDSEGGLMGKLSVLGCSKEVPL